MWRTILRVYAFLFFQNSYGKRFVLALFYWLLRALLRKYLLNYRYSYRHYYVKAVEYLIKDFLKKNKVTIIISLAYLCPKSALIIQQNSDNIENF